MNITNIKTHSSCSYLESDIYIFEFEFWITISNNREKETYTEGIECIHWGVNICWGVYVKCKVLWINFIKYKMDRPKRETEWNEKNALGHRSKWMIKWTKWIYYNNRKWIKWINSNGQKTFRASQEIDLHCFLSEMWRTVSLWPHYVFVFFGH